MDTRDFASVAKEARQAKGFTLQALATKLGTQKGYCSGIENRKVNPPSPKIVRKMAKLFDLDVQELLILAQVEKAPEEVREIMREGSLAALEEAREQSAKKEPASA